VAVVGFRRQGQEHIEGLRKVPGVRVVALCDVDQEILDREVKKFKDRSERIDAYTDVRKLLEDKNIDAIDVCTPHHWHSLMAIWGCQAGKDVCVEKPVSHNIWEGRKMVEAARKYNRVVQGDFDNRSTEALRQAIEYVQQGNLGKILAARGFCYKRRQSIGKVDGPQPIPPTVDYDLWSGPAPKGPLMRKHLDYDWHWQWAWGNGEIGNTGPHKMDVTRWALGQNGLPAGVMSVSGRFGYVDDGETPNTQIVLLDYKPAPIIYEVRGLSRKQGDTAMDSHRWLAKNGRVYSQPPAVGGSQFALECEGGYLWDTTIYDHDNKPIKSFSERGLNPRENFIKAVRSRRIADLKCDILDGHLSSALCHMANIAHRVGTEHSPGEIREAIHGDKEALDAFERFVDHLAANDVDLKQTPAVLSPWLKMDPKQERFYGEFSDRANKLVTRDYRKPFVVPEKV
jgi:predicted dehydrogenase